MSWADSLWDDAGAAGAAAINRVRTLFVLKSREYKGLFFGENGDLRREGERVLADLRRFCRAGDATIFSTDALEMARREGRREVFVRISNLLNLDEEMVQKLMEADYE